MANWFYYDIDGQKQGPYNGGQLKWLAKNGKITPDTVVETEEGKTAPARKVKGLTFIAAQNETVQLESPQPIVNVSVPLPVEPNPFAAVRKQSSCRHYPDQTEQASSPPISTQEPFCTNCGQSVAEQAFACMSCGAAPVGHKKFCRRCGVGLNPEQIVCIKCGTGVGTTTSQSTEGGTTTSTEAAPIVNTSQGTSSAALMWMHWAWLVFPPASLIIWSIGKDKEPHATTHGKHILNAFLTLLIDNFIFGAVIGITMIVRMIALENVTYESEEIVWEFGSGLVCLVVAVFALFVGIRAIISAIKIGTAAGNGEVLPYRWAWCFCKTGYLPQKAERNSNTALMCIHWAWLISILLSPWCSPFLSFLFVSVFASLFGSLFFLASIFHLLVLFIFPLLVPFGIGISIRKKSPQSVEHLKNVFLAHSTVAFICLGLIVVSYLANYILDILIGDIGMYIILIVSITIIPVLFIGLIFSVRQVAMAAKEEKALPYWWAIPFSKIDQQ